MRTEVWCWMALCAKNKLRITWHVGECNHRAGLAFCHNLAKRSKSLSFTAKADRL
jgi:hypothetical protein